VIRRSDPRETEAVPASADGSFERGPVGRSQPQGTAWSWIVGLVGCMIGAGIVLRLLIPAGWDPTIFLAFGEQAPAQTEYAESLLGEVETRPNRGHDGKYFFVQANDPWYLEPRDHAQFLDRPIYRAQRMLYPMVAGGFGFFGPGLVAWSMVITNVIGLGVGAFLAARIAVLAGASPWLGLAVPLNIGLLFELWIGGSGILAYTFCLGAVYALALGREGVAAALFAGAVLSRETMIVFAVGVFALIWLEHRRLAWKLVVVPAVVVAIWNAYLQLRLMGVPGGRDTWPFFGLPFVGLAEAFRAWARDPTYLVLNLAILVLVVAFVAGAIRDRTPIVWGALPFVALATLLSIYVWGEPFDFSRALAPVFTAVPFLLFVPKQDEAVPVAEPR
jgi:hypothetical protein